MRYNNLKFCLAAKYGKFVAPVNVLCDMYKIVCFPRNFSTTLGFKILHV